MSKFVDMGTPVICGICRWEGPVKNLIHEERPSMSYRCPKCSSVLVLGIFGVLQLVAEVARIFSGPAAAGAPDHE